MHTEFKWTIEPRDLFEQAEKLDIAGFVVQADNGGASIELAGDRSQDSALQDALQKGLERHVAGQGLAQRRPAVLSSKPAVIVTDDAGHRAINVFLEARVTATCSMSADVLATDGEGRVVRDTRAERLSRQRELRASVARWIDEDRFLATLLALHRRAAEDSENVLVHLYAIREAVRMKFGSELQAKDALGISGTRWSRLGVLTNELPLQEGRHAGRHHEVLRQATDPELHEAWKIAEELIEAYLKWLNSVGDNR